MEYPLISEYRDAILSAEDNFKELSTLRPVLDGRGNPVMSSGNFAVIFKMRDEVTGKLYAVKCFIKEQERRNESYRKIADELECASSSYIVPLRYLEDELFVDSEQCDSEEFPVVLMDWVEGQTVSSYIEQHIDNRYDLEMLSYRFNRMAAWLLTQPFAHGDLKPDNILVREDGSLVLVDYDGMYVPSMKGESAREIGSPDYRHPSRTEKDFDEHIEDFSIAVIALSLKTIALKPKLRSTSTNDTLLFTERDFQDTSMSSTLNEVLTLASDKELCLLLGAFFITLAKNSLELLSFRTLLTEKPEKLKLSLVEEIVDTSVNDDDLAEGVADEFGVIYSKDGIRLLKCPDKSLLVNYNIKEGTKMICDCAFAGCESLQRVTIPNSVTTIGERAFRMCESLRSANLPSSVKTLAPNPFSGCGQLHLSISEKSRFTVTDGLLVDERGFLISCISQSLTIEIPNSVTRIGDNAFRGCESLERVTIPNSVTTIGDGAFSDCVSLESVTIPNLVTTIGVYAFSHCFSLQSVIIPDSVSIIGRLAFHACESLESVTIPNSVTTIEFGAFLRCFSLQSVIIPDKLILDKKVFPSNCKVIRRK